MVFDRGNGIYRGIIAALAGLILLGVGNPPKTAGDNSQAKAEKPEQRGTPTVPLNASKAIPELKAEKKQEPCGNHRYTSNDELCAQWKAADAATDAAKWAEWQLWLSGFGVVGLLISLVFTHRSIKLANDTHKAFIRAEDAFLIFSFPDGAQDAVGDFLFDMVVMNVGRSAATIHSIEICGETVLMQRIFPAEKDFRFNRFAIVPATANRNLTLTVRYSTPFRSDDELKANFSVLQPKGSHETWWAIEITTT